jgi:phosphotriesterase-related protein
LESTFKRLRADITMKQHTRTTCEHEPISRRAFLEQAGAAAGVFAAANRLLGQESKSAAVRGPAVRTVLGPVAPDKLGVTLMHEHAPLVDWSELYEAPAAPFAPVRDEMLARAVRLLGAFQKSLAAGDGPGAIVECTPIRAGRYPQLLVELARQIPVHIIGCTGFWCEAMAPQHPWAVQLSATEQGTKQLAELFIREITEGMEDPTGRWGERFTQVKAGIIKCATSKFLRPSERRCHAAAAIASRETGCPITTHTTDGGGLEQAQLLLQLGVKPEKLIIGHQGNQDDREHDAAHEYHRQLAALGCSLQFDRIGHEKYPVPKMVELIKRLVDAGHAKQVLVSHDHVPYFYPDYTASQKSPQKWKAEDPDFTIVTTQFAEACKAAGMSDRDLRTILIENPRRILAF